MPVVEVACQRREPEWAEGVTHHSQLGRLRTPSAFSARPGAAHAAVPTDGASRADRDPLARAEVAGDVVDHLLRLQIAVVIRDRHRLWVEVEMARTERADDEVRPLEGLVRGRRLVDPPGDRLEVVDRERPRVQEAVPADDVERVVVEDVVLVPAADADLDEVVAPVTVRLELGRRMDVAVVVRRALEDLAVLVAVAARDLDQPRASRRRDIAAAPCGTNRYVVPRGTTT